MDGTTKPRRPHVARLLRNSEHRLIRLMDQAASTTDTSGALALTEAMPFSMAAKDAYISLCPMNRPLAALKTK